MKSLIVLTICLATALAAVPLESRDASPLIVGGQRAVKYQYPYQVRLFITTGATNAICGGSIINKKYILTAAHCVYPATVKVTVNVGYLDAENKDGEEKDFDVDRINNHWMFNRLTFDNDISILRVRGEINMTRLAQPMHAFAKPGEDRQGVATATGWGTTEEKGQPSQKLMWVDLPIVDDAVCKKGIPFYNPKLMMCAGFVEGGKDTCQGDSGGPLVLNAHSDPLQPVQVGIVSHGNGCARKDYPGVYTRVSAFTDWIAKNSKC